MDNGHYETVAKNLLVGKSCNNCRHLNPYDWPQIWCHYSLNEPEVKVCPEHLEGIEKGFLPRKA